MLDGEAIKNSEHRCLRVCLWVAMVSIHKAKSRRGRTRKNTLLRLASMRQRFAFMPQRVALPSRSQTGRLRTVRPACICRLRLPPRVRSHLGRRSACGKSASRTTTCAADTAMMLWLKY
jgi:hypothetical protein